MVPHHKILVECDFYLTPLLPIFVAASSSKHTAPLRAYPTSSVCWDIFPGEEYNMNEVGRLFAKLRLNQQRRPIYNTAGRDPGISFIAKGDQSAGRGAIYTYLFPKGDS